MSVSLINRPPTVDHVLNVLEKETQGLLNGRTVRHITEPSFLKTWEIVICAITVIGLFVLLGLYCKRRNAWATEQAQAENKKQTEIENILIENPKWLDISQWKGISLEDRLWLLQICQLRELGIHDLNPFFKEFPDLKKALELVSNKTAINVVLQQITQFSCPKDLEEFPNAIYLLKNLTLFSYTQKGLKKAPNVSQFPHLEDLRLGGNELEVAPDVSKNPKLKILSLFANLLKTPPDTFNNPNLEQLVLDENKLASLPNVSRNKKLTILSLSMNLIDSPPDLTNNVKLQRLRLGTTNISAVPDTSKNLELVELDLGSTRILEIDPPVHLKKLKDLNITDIPVSNSLQTWADNNNVTLTI